MEIATTPCGAPKALAEMPEVTHVGASAQLTAEKSAPLSGSGSACQLTPKSFEERMTPAPVATHTPERSQLTASSSPTERASWTLRQDAPEVELA